MKIVTKHDKGMNMQPYIKHPRSTGAEQPWTIPALCAAYGWPTGLPAGGAIGIVELGGGWLQTDVDSAFATMGLPAPSITDVSVDGTTNDFANGGNANGEVALDIQVAAAAYTLATGESAIVRVYWCKDIGVGVRAAADDGCAVCSISWGAPEEAWGEAAVVSMNDAAVYAINKGCTVFAAAGDNDSDDGARTPSVDCPACCPQVIACGGTMKPRDGEETVWNNNPGHPNGEGTGGGYSRYFPAQHWQLGAAAAPHGLGRMVPDVAGNADPNTGYEIVVNGGTDVIGGTSAVAPLWAGLIAAINKAPGWITPRLYQNPEWFNDITIGNNGTYAAHAGPDACTGLGTPKASMFKL